MKPKERDHTIGVHNFPKDIVDLKSIVAIMLWLSALAVFTVLGSIYFVSALFIAPKRLHGLARWGCRWMLWSAGIRLETKGSFPSSDSGPYVYVFNHSSLLDTFVVIALIPEWTAAIGKAEQFKVPLWGWILKRWGAVPIHRSDLNRAIEV